jgi:hypothetical protein
MCTAQQGTIILTFFKKMENVEGEMDANLNLQYEPFVKGAFKPVFLGVFSFKVTKSCLKGHHLFPNNLS